MQQPLGRPVSAKTSLPPGIPGPPFAYLLLQVTLFRNTTRRSLPLKHLAVRVVWWGEDSSDGAALLLRPRIAQHPGSQKETQVRSHTRYPVCVPLHKMHSYLEDMGCLFLDVVDESNGAIIGRGKVDNLERLTPRNPIKSVVAVANARGSKIGELTVNLSYELLQVTQSHGIRKKHQSLPRVTAMSLKRLQSAVPRTSISNPAINVLDTEDHNLKAEPLFRIPTLDGTDETRVQNTGLGKDTEVKTAPFVEENDEFGLGMEEVLVRIQSALKESRRIRQRVLGEINTEAERMDETLIIKPDSPDIQQSNEDEELGVEKKSDFTINQAETQLSSTVSSPPTEMHFGLLDDVNGLFDDDCWGACTDTDLERDVVIDNALLPRPNVATQSEANVSNEVEDLHNVDRSGGEVVKQTKKSTFENSPSIPPKSAAQDPPCDSSLSAVRLTFRRLTFPMQMWNAMGTVMTALAAEERKKSSHLANQHQRQLQHVRNMKGDEDRRPLQRRMMLANQQQKPRLMNCAGGVIRLKDGLQRSKTGRIVQKRSTDKSPIKGVSIQAAKDLSNKSWDLYLEILVPTDLVDEESNTGLSFQPLIEDLTLWCQRIHLCRGISKHSVPNFPSTSTSSAPMVIIVPQRGMNGDNSLPPEALVLSSNQNGNLEILPIRLQIFCKPPLVTPSGPIIMLVGSIELPYHALISSLYHTSPSNPSELQKASPKTLRVCIDFAEPVQKTSPMQENLLNQGDSLPPTNLKDATPPSPFQLDVLLNVREARDLHSSQSNGRLQHSFLVIRIPWCSEETLVDQRIVYKTKRFHSAISWGSGATPAFHFGLRASALLSQEQMVRLSKAFIAVEVWERHTGCGAERDEIIGLAKVMTLGLASLYPLNVSPKKVTESRVPLLQEEAWLQVSSPSTGQVCGQLRTRFSAGTANQISVLLEVDRETAVAGCTDWRCIDFIRWKEPSIISGSHDSCCYSRQSHGNEEYDCASSLEELISISVKHSLDISLLSLTDFRPSLSESLQKELGVDMFLFNDCDCFIQYMIPSDLEANSSTFRSPLRPLRPLLQPTDIRQSPLSKDVEKYRKSSNDEKPTRDVHSGVEVEWKEGSLHESHSHTFVIEASSEKNILNSANRLDSLAFLIWLGRGAKPSESGIPFEFWLRLYSPKLRDICVARGVLPWDLLERHLMPPPIIPSSIKSLKKLDNFLPEWSRDLSRHSLSLFDVLSNKFSARLFLNIVYRLKTAIRHLSGTIINDPGESRATCVLCHPRAAFHLAPSTARPGIHLHVNLLALSGLKAAASGLGGTARLQLRMHCLLLLPPTKCLHHANPPRLLATTVSKTPLTAFHASQEELKMRLDVLLPLGWTYTTSSSHECLPPHKNAGGKENFTSFSLAEALAYGRMEIADREAWLCGRVKRPCLVIQLDVWEMEDVDDSNLIEDQLTFWNIDYDIESDMKMGLAGKFFPLASCRVPLSDLLFSGVLTPRWFTLLQTPSSPSRLQEPARSYHLAGAFELSASLGAVSTRRKALEEVVSQASPMALQSLHSLGFNLAAGSVSRICLSPKNAKMNDEKRQLALYFLAAHLPTEESLLSPDELETCEERGLQGYFFARAVMDSDFQMSNSHPLPRSSNKLAGDGDRGVVMEELMHDFKISRVGTITERGALVWFSDALANKNLPVLYSTVDRDASPTKVESFPAYVHLERANRLVSDATRLDRLSMETFATFVVADENRVEMGAQRVVVTPLASHRASPVWNYRRYVRLPLALTTTGSQGFVVDFWEKSQGETHPLHLGTATMQLFTLILPRAASSSATNTAMEKAGVGLEFVRGWYEILDQQGTSRGQVLMAVYPLAENEENPYARRLCPRLEALLEPGSAVRFQEIPAGAPPIHRRKSPKFDSIPALTVSPPSSEKQAFPSNSSQKLTGLREVEQGQLIASMSSLLTALQSRLDELDVQNARFKQKLLELSNEPREVEATPAESPRSERPGKGCKMHKVSPDPSQNEQKEENLPPSYRTQYSSTTDNFLFLCGTGDNNSKIRTASSASSITSKSDSSDGMILDEEEDEQAEVMLIEGDSMDECEEIEEDNVSEPENQPAFSENDSSEQKETEARQHKIMDQECTETGHLPLPRISTSKLPGKEAYDDDRTSLASSTSASTIASLGTRLLLKEHLGEPTGSELFSKNVQSTSQKEGNDCPSTWSASSTDVEEYLQRFRQDLADQPKFPTIMPSPRKLVISEEEAETLTSLQTHACIARTISTRSTEDRRTEADVESAEYDEPTGVGDLLEEDSASDSATISMKPPRKFMPNCSDDAPWRDANAPVSHCHLQALKLARKAAESVRLQKPARVNSPSRPLGQEFIEDPIRQRIHANLSSLVRKTNSTTGDRLQRSEATAAAILKSTSQEDTAMASTSTSQLSSSATAVQLSSRSLARAARIFEMKL
ncbi:C2 domain containing protein 3 [Echinococcus multilocularis]|uniref:C2 domain containing protein 3 n=1 Tax=Echinococcus multilocularis TaxID=6211 RepID=A0A068Y0E4_ECHMU|nr:C2 domain containing protein 3 [Echinococcus multilocularis]